MGRERHSAMFTAMLGLMMTDRDAVLFGLAMAETDDKLKDTKLAAMFRAQALELGITEEEISEATDAMRATNNLLGEDNGIE